MIAGRLTFAFALFAAVATSQAPEYAQQYRQRLGGALDELTAIVDQFASEAAATGRTVSQAVATLEANAEPLARGRGRAMAETIARRNRLADQSARFAGAGPYGRLSALVLDFDPQIARGAFAQYEPGLPLTSEGLVVAGAGGAFVYGLAGFLRLVVARSFSRRGRTVRR